MDGRERHPEQVVRLESYEDLLLYLRNWSSWPSQEVYDFFGMVHLLGACLDNLRTYANDGEVEDIMSTLETEQVEFLRRILAVHRPVR